MSPNDTRGERASSKVSRDYFFPFSRFELFLKRKITFLEQISSLNTVIFTEKALKRLVFDFLDTEKCYVRLGGGAGY